MSRECGDCVVCCVYPRIDAPELSKAGMRHCPHLTLSTGVAELGGGGARTVFYTGASDRNCAAHGTDQRPACCEAYRCAWRRGYGGDGDRPDKVLMLFDGSKLIENSLEAKPLRDGQEDTPEGRAVVARMSRSTGVPVIVLNFYERKIQRLVGQGL